MLNSNIKRFPLVSFQAQLRSPAIYPIMGYAARDFSRRISTRLNHPPSRGTKRIHDQKLSTNTMLTPVTPTASFLHDLEHDFFQGTSSLMKSPLVMPFLKQMEWIDDMRRKSYFPNVHIKHEEDKQILSLELPGVSMDEINVEVKDDKVLHISGEKKTENEDGTKSEIKFDKQFAFADTVDTKNILANLKDGILRVTLPQLPKSQLPPEKIRKIDISTAGNTGLE